MSKTLKYTAITFALPLFTALVWVIWLGIRNPSVRNEFLSMISPKIEQNLKHNYVYDNAKVFKRAVKSYYKNRR